MAVSKSPRGGRIKGLAVLGSTGSIGQSTLEVARRHPERFRIVALSAGKNIDLLNKQIREFAPEFVSVVSEKDAERLKRNIRGLKRTIEVGSGTGGAVKAATWKGVDLTVSAISGSAGLVPTMASIKAGKDIALANKEALVMAGPIVMEEVKKRGVRLLPVDSEHSAIFQAILGHRKEHIKRIILTASGGPFLKLPLRRLEGITPEEALRHPNWAMGRKITVDSATLMNKGLEVIEARWLFGVGAEKISVAIHPQSIVHSMVEFIDGSIVAQMGKADMKGPISYALSFPERIGSRFTQYLDLNGLKLEFLEPEKRRFPCLNLAYRAIEAGGSAPCVLNAADEVAVESFLKRRIAFTSIYRTIAAVLERHKPVRISSLGDILDADRRAREEAEKVIKRLQV